ncbi:MAG: hypothetical protein AAGF97_19095 [Planctomycetota bacterium]
MQRKPVWNLCLCVLSLLCGSVAAKVAAQATLANRFPHLYVSPESGELDLVQVTVASHDPLPSSDFEPTL